MHQRRVMQNRRLMKQYLKRVIVLIIATVCSLFLIICCLQFFSQDVLAISESLMTKYYTNIEIKSGDTLWDIAKQYNTEPNVSIHEYIYELKQINGLKSDKIIESNYLTVVYYK